MIAKASTSKRYPLQRWLSWTQSQLWTRQRDRLPTQVIQICSGQLTIATLHAKSLQSGPTLCEPMGCCPPGSSAHGILQARILEWVAMPSSRGSSQPKDQTQASRYRMADNEVKLSFSIAWRVSAPNPWIFLNYFLFFQISNIIPYALNRT